MSGVTEYYVYKYTDGVVSPVNIGSYVPDKIGVDKSSGNVYVVCEDYRLLKVIGSSVTSLVEDVRSDSGLTSIDKVMASGNYIYIFGGSYAYFDCRVAKFDSSGNFIEVFSFSDMGLYAFTMSDTDWYFYSRSSEEIEIYTLPDLSSPSSAFTPHFGEVFCMVISDDLYTVESFEGVFKVCSYSSEGEFIDMSDELGFDAYYGICYY